MLIQIERVDSDDFLEVGHVKTYNTATFENLSNPEQLIQNIHDSSGCLVADISMADGTYVLVLYKPYENTYRTKKFKTLGGAERALAQHIETN